MSGEGEERPESQWPARIQDAASWNVAGALERFLGDAELRQML